MPLLYPSSRQLFRHPFRSSPLHSYLLQVNLKSNFTFPFSYSSFTHMFLPYPPPPQLFPTLSTSFCSLFPSGFLPTTSHSEKNNSPFPHLIHYSYVSPLPILISALAHPFYPYPLNSFQLHSYLILATLKKNSTSPFLTHRLPI